MSALSITDSKLSILQSNHMTATVDTEKGRYTVISRPRFVVVVRDKDGKVAQGTKLQVIEGRLCLTGGDKNYASTPITGIYILSN